VNRAPFRTRATTFGKSARSVLALMVVDMVQLKLNMSAAHASSHGGDSSGYFLSSAVQLTITVSAGRAG
jgi:hypothetical protein